MEIYITTPNLESIKQSSSEIITTDYFTPDHLDISGSGMISTAADATEIDAFISGSGNISVSVERYLNATISGSGNIYYYGTPDIETHISGSGKVMHENQQIIINSKISTDEAISNFDNPNYFRIFFMGSGF